MRRVPLFALLLAALPSAADDPKFPSCRAAEKAGVRTGDGGWVFSGHDQRMKLTMVPEATAGLDRLLDALAASPIEVIVAAYPSRPLVVPEVLGPPWDAAADLASYREIVGHVADHGLRVVGLYDTARSVRGAEAFYFRRDHLITPTGARAVGRALADAIRADPVSARLRPATFTSRPTTHGPREADSRGRALEALCGTPVPIQEFQRWETVRTSASTVGLLDDDAGADVVFVGTSNLSTQYNLPGFLQEALGAEVLALRVASGGLLGSLQDWLRSPGREAHPPAFLIWEYNPQDLMKDPDGAPDPRDAAVYRELVPSVLGGCTDADAAALGPWVVAAAGEHLLLPDVQAAGARGPGWRVLVETEDPALRTFTLELELADGTHDAHTYTPSMRTETYGRFFLDLPRGAAAPLARVRARLDAPAAGRVRARLCRPRQQ